MDNNQLEGLIEQLRNKLRYNKNKNKNNQREDIIRKYMITRDKATITELYHLLNMSHTTIRSTLKKISDGKEFLYLSGTGRHESTLFKLNHDSEQTKILREIIRMQPKQILPLKQLKDITGIEPPRIAAIINNELPLQGRYFVADMNVIRRY